MILAEFKCERFDSQIRGRSVDVQLRATSTQLNVFTVWIMLYNVQVLQALEAPHEGRGLSTRGPARGTLADRHTHARKASELPAPRYTPHERRVCRSRTQNAYHTQDEHTNGAVGEGWEDASQTSEASSGSGQDDRPLGNLIRG